MSTWRYFVTEDELNAKTGQMVRKAKELRERLAKLDDELKEFAKSWSELGRAAFGVSSRSFQIDEKGPDVLTQYRQRLRLHRTVEALHRRATIKRSVLRIPGRSWWTRRIAWSWALMAERIVRRR